MRPFRTPVSHRGPRVLSLPPVSPSGYSRRYQHVCTTDFFSAMHGVGVPFGHRPRARACAEAVVSYGVPEGFSEIELDNTASYVATYDGKTLPAWSFAEAGGAGIRCGAVRGQWHLGGRDQRHPQRRVRIDYKQCASMAATCRSRATMSPSTRCVARWIFAARGRITWRRPVGVGLVSSHAIDLRGSSDGYRSANVYGNTWLGLPGRSFGYVSWYGGRSRTPGPQHQQPGAVVVLPAKELLRHLCAGGQTEQHRLRVRLGQHRADPQRRPFRHHRQPGQSAQSAQRRLAGAVRRPGATTGSTATVAWCGSGRPTLGRNEVSYLDLPGGYYPLEIAWSTATATCSTAKRGTSTT